MAFSWGIPVDVDVDYSVTVHRQDEIRASGPDPRQLSGKAACRGGPDLMLAWGAAHRRMIDDRQVGKLQHDEALANWDAEGGRWQPAATARVAPASRESAGGTRRRRC